MKGLKGHKWERRIREINERLKLYDAESAKLDKIINASIKRKKIIAIRYSKAVKFKNEKLKDN